MNLLFRWAFIDNKWLWFHILAGGIAARLGMLFFADWQILTLIASAAVIWELFEFLAVVSGVNPYGEIRRFLADATGDIVGALVMALIVIY